jgi:hypothetical protein
MPSDLLASGPSEFVGIGEYSGTNLAKCRIIKANLCSPVQTSEP